MRVRSIIGYNVMIKLKRSFSLLPLLLLVAGGFFVVYGTNLGAPAPHYSIAANGKLSLFTEPQAGTAPVLAAIQAAGHEIDLVEYELGDQQLEDALIAAAGRGVTVHVMLNRGYDGKPAAMNKAAYGYLQDHQVSVRWSPAFFTLTHQKTMIVDGNTAIIMTFNLTPQYYATSRDFGLIDRDSNDVAATRQTFAADWNGQPGAVVLGDDLLWSPGAKAQLLALINGSKKTLVVYNEEMADDSMTHALEAAAGRGVMVRVVMTDQADWHEAFAELKAAGVQVRTYAASAPLYIHAKMVVADGAEAYLGSQNFSEASLLHNRELGLITPDPSVISPLETTFSRDWSGVID